MNSPNTEAPASLPSSVPNVPIELLVTENGNSLINPQDPPESISQETLKYSWFQETYAPSTLDPKQGISLYPYKLIQMQDDKVYSTFTLPITPQQLDITTPFAITVTPTLNGLVEEHNSTRFRDITIAGTMGVMSGRGIAGQKPISGPLDIASKFSGISDTLYAVAGSIPYLQVRQFKSQNLESLDKGTNAAKNLGYIHLHSLRYFLEAYAEEKKKNAGLRLVFANYKDKQMYYVTPINFVVRRSADSPLEYRYQLQLRAWRRFDPNTQTPVQNPVHSDASTIASNILGGIEGAKAVIAATGNIGGFVGSIVDSISVEIASSIGVLSTAVRNLSTSVSKVSPSNFSNTLNGYVYPVSQAVKGLVNSTASYQQSLTINQTQTLPQQYGQQGIPLTSKDYNRFAKQTIDACANVADSIGLGNDAFDIYAGRERLPTLISTPSPSQIQLMYSLNDASLGFLEASTVYATNAPIAASPLDYVAGLAARSGIAFRVPASKFPVPFPYGMTLEQLSARYLGSPNSWIEIATLNGLREPYIDHVGFDAPLLGDGYQNKIVISGKFLTVTQAVTLFSTTQPRATYSVLSVRELSPGLFEATLNNDPNGDSLSRFTVADKAYVHYYTPNTIHAGQMVYIPSSTPVLNDYNTSSIPEVEQFNQLIQVSGVDLLLTQNNPSQTVTVFTGVASTTIQNVLAGATVLPMLSVNGFELNDIINIGSGGNAEQKTITKIEGSAITVDSALAYPHSATTTVQVVKNPVLNKVERIGTFDLALDTSINDVPISMGLTNIIQSLYMILFTKQGSLLQHPDFGVGMPVAESVADVNLSGIGEAIKTSILRDPSFSDVEYLNLNLDKAVLRIQLAVRVAGTNNLLPVDFNVNLQRT